MSPTSYQTAPPRGELFQDNTLPNSGIPPRGPKTKVQFSKDLLTGDN